MMPSDKEDSDQQDNSSVDSSFELDEDLHQAKPSFPAWDEYHSGEKEDSDVESVRSAIAVKVGRLVERSDSISSDDTDPEVTKAVLELSRQTALEEEQVRQLQAHKDRINAKRALVLKAAEDRLAVAKAPDDSGSDWRHKYHP